MPKKERSFVRKFNGKNYYLTGGAVGVQSRDAIKKHLKEKGKLVRVEKVKKPKTAIRYWLYERKK